MEILPIHTERLVLRRFAREDLRSFQSYRSDPEVARYQGWSQMTDAEAEAFLEEQGRAALGDAGEWLQVAVARRDTGEVIGDLGVCIVDDRGSVAEIGFTLARGAQGSGYATEAVRALLETLFARTGVARVVAVTDTRNDASTRLLRRAGMTLEQTESAVFRGEICTEHTFAATRATAARS